MHFLKTLIAGAALVASVVAQGDLAFTSFPPPNVVAGTPVTVTWTGGDPTEPVTITLRRGPRDDLQDVEVLSSSATGGSFTWTPEDDIVNGDDYALQISQGEEVNYTDLFSISGGSEAPTATPTATITLSSVTSSSTTEASSSRTVTISTSSVPVTTSESVVSTMTQTTLVPTTSEASTTSAAPEPTETDNAASSPAYSSSFALLGALAAFIYF